MCAIVDANVVSELWDNSGSTAGQAFRRWVEGPRGQLVVGGELTQELVTASAGRWLQQLRLAGRLSRVDDATVDRHAADLRAAPRGTPESCKSNDHHVIALARASGARMLYSNDRALQADFKNTSLISLPAGKVYSTIHSKSLTRSRKEQLGRHSCV